MNVSRTVIRQLGDCHQQGMTNWRQYTRNTNSSLAVCWSVSSSNISQVSDQQFPSLRVFTVSFLLVLFWLILCEKGTVKIVTVWTAVTTHCGTFYPWTMEQIIISPRDGPPSPSGRSIAQDSVSASPGPPATGHQPRHRGEGRKRK